jgi:alkanesulfonate monooxygenase SsuD/methylene tetrahydromethanopterin reductase-like flavin-dependent oxidoreductase (luciferase family)
VRYGLWAPNYGTLADVALMADLAARAEQAGWDGWFVHDHVVHMHGDEPVADPWMALAVVARSTSRIRLGPMVTPLPRRRPWNVARQATTLDHLSNGRVVLGVGIGSERTPEYREFGEVTDLATRAAMLDEGLELLTAIWSGARVDHVGEHYRVEGVTFAPTPVQQPLPVWVAAIGPNPRALRRAERWQGIFPLALASPDALRQITATLGPASEVVVAEDDHPASAWAEAGATWWLQSVSADATARELEVMMDAGPPRQDGSGHWSDSRTTQRPSGSR